MDRSLIIASEVLGPNCHILLCYINSASMIYCIRLILFPLNVQTMKNCAQTSNWIYPCDIYWRLILSLKCRVFDQFQSCFDCINNQNRLLELIYRITNIYLVLLYNIYLYDQYIYCAEVKVNIYTQTMAYLHDGATM